MSFAGGVEIRAAAVVLLDAARPNALGAFGKLPRRYASVFKNDAPGRNILAQLLHLRPEEGLHLGRVTAVLVGGREDPPARRCRKLWRGRRRSRRFFAIMRRFESARAVLRQTTPLPLRGLCFFQTEACSSSDAV